MKYITPILDFMASGHVCLYCYTHWPMRTNHWLDTDLLWMHMCLCIIIALMLGHMRVLVGFNQSL